MRCLPLPPCGFGSPGDEVVAPLLTPSGIRIACSRFVVDESEIMDWLPSSPCELLHVLARRIDCMHAGPEGPEAHFDCFRIVAGFAIWVDGCSVTKTDH